MAYVLCRKLIFNKAYSYNKVDIYILVKPTAPISQVTPTFVPNFCIKVATHFTSVSKNMQLKLVILNHVTLIHILLKYFVPPFNKL